VGTPLRVSRPSREEMEKVQRMSSAPTPQVQRQQVDQVVNQLVDAFGATEVPARSVEIKNPGEPASPKQLGMIRAMLRGKEITETSDVVDLCGATIGRLIEKMDDLTKGEASQLITAFK
jgi:hypothetical protein